jgi:hypothetical protein
VPYGDLGSTINDELNRLANGGTYPARSAYLDQAGAAQAWAARKGVNLDTVTDVVGVVNYIGGITNRSNMLDFAGIANKIAGTFGLDTSAALGRILS